MFATRVVVRIAVLAWLASAVVVTLDLVEPIDLAPVSGIMLAVAGTLTVMASTRRNQDKALAEVFKHATMLGRQLPRDDAAIVSTQWLPVPATASARARVPGPGEPQSSYESRQGRL